MKRFALTMCALLCVAGSSAWGEPIPISPQEVPLTITNAAAYVLTGDAVVTNPAAHGIQVEADGVTIDLGGHTLQGPGDGSGNGITLAASFRGLRVLNGTITNWLGGTGVRNLGEVACVETVVVEACGLGMTLGPNALVTGCTVAGGSEGIVAGTNSAVAETTVYECAGTGFRVGADSRMRLCTAYTNEVGIEAGPRTSLELCTSYENRGVGIVAGEDCRIDVSVAYENALGIRADAGVLIRRSTVRANRGSGLEAAASCDIEECAAWENGGAGMAVSGDAQVMGNAAGGNCGPGILARGSGNRIEGNRCDGNTWGIQVTSSGNVIRQNKAERNRDGDFAIADGNETDAQPEQDGTPGKH